MSDENSDAGLVVSSVPEELQDTPALSDLSERDKPWDKHKHNSDRVSSHYQGSRYHKYSQRTEICANLLDFRLVPENKDGTYRLKLAAARFCRVRHCPVCQWRRSLMWKAKAYQALPRAKQDYPKYRWLFLTLTVRNCPVQEIRKTLDWMNKSFVRLTKLKEWPAVGWIKSIEVTRGKDGNARPHIHCLLMVAPSYFGAIYPKNAGLNYGKSQRDWTTSLKLM